MKASNYKERITITFRIVVSHGLRYNTFSLLEANLFKVQAMRRLRKCNAYLLHILVFFFRI